MRRFPFVLASFVCAAVVLPFACTDADDIRRGQAGESCTRTDDCLAPLVCIQQTCVDRDNPGGGTPTGSTSEGGTGGTAGTGSTSETGGGGTGGGTTSVTTGDGGTGGGTTTTTSTSTWTGGLDPEQCALCLDQACTVEKAACGSECLAIQACIEMLCAHLSAIGSDEEGECQVHCQTPHLTAKQAHLDIVFCAIGAWPGCDPCSSYPFDYDACILKAIDGGPCEAAYAACNSDTDCQQYRECVSSCSTLDACLACDNTPEGMAGAALLEEYHQCIATECIAEAWLP